MFPTWGNGQLEGEWEGEHLAAGNDSAVQDQQRLNVNYPPPPGVSNCIFMCSFNLID